MPKPCQCDIWDCCPECDPEAHKKHMKAWTEAVHAENQRELKRRAEGKTPRFIIGGEDHGNKTKR